MAEAAEQPNNTGSRYLTTRNEIVRVLKVFRDQRSPIGLQFEGEAQSFTVRILDVSTSGLILEDIQPRTGIVFMNQQRPFSLACRAEGVYLYITESHADRTDSERGIPYFHVNLPQRALFQQRRRADRVQLPLRVSTQGAQVRLFRSGALTEEPLIGTIIDVSVSGCRAQFDDVPTSAIRQDETVKQCEISVPRLLVVHAEAIVRHFTVSKSGSRITAGIELTEMPITDRRRLEQFVQQIGRAQKPT